MFSFLILLSPFEEACHVTFCCFYFLFLLKHCICWLDMLNIISKEYSFQGGPLCLVGLIYTYFSS